MTYSEIKITFNRDVNPNDIFNSVTFVIWNLSNDLQSNVYEKWTGIRIKPNQVSTGLPTSILGERSAINYIQSFNLDYNSSGIYEVSRVDNEVNCISVNTNND